MDWSHTWEELTEAPQPNSNGLYIPLRQAKKVLGLFNSSESGKLVPIQSQEKCEVRHFLGNNLYIFFSFFVFLVCVLTCFFFLVSTDNTKESGKTYEILNYFFVFGQRGFGMELFRHAGKFSPSHSLML